MTNSARKGTVEVPMVPEMEQLYGRMAQVAHEIHELQEKWDALLRDVQQIRYDAPETTSSTPPVVDSVPSYGAQYTMIAQPYGTSVFRTAFESPSVESSYGYSPAPEAGMRVGRQSEHTSYGRGV